MSVETLLARLDDPRPNGRDRWRCACPVCGGSNRSTLSVGIGDTGAVLLKCWKEGCSPEQIAQAIGLELTDLFPPTDRSSASMKRRRLITAGQALQLLDEEANLIAVSAASLATGAQLTAGDLDRLLTAAARVSVLREECRA